MIAIRLQFLLVLVLVGPVVGVEPGVDYLPPETRMILRTNTQVLLASPLLKKTNILANPVAFSPVGGKFVTQIDRVLIGYPATDAPDKGTTVVLGKFDLAAFDAEMATAVKESKVKVNETPEGKIYERQGVVKMLPGIPKSDHVYFALLDAETLIASVQEDQAFHGEIADALGSRVASEVWSGRPVEFQFCDDRLVPHASRMIPPRG